MKTEKLKFIEFANVQRSLLDSNPIPQKEMRLTEIRSSFLLAPVKFN